MNGVKIDESGWLQLCLPLSLKRKKLPKKKLKHP